MQQNQNPDTVVQEANCGIEPSTPKHLERPSEDGYNWRKYGQKNVMGYQYIRCYYKCSHRNCLVKKRVEHSQDGHVTGTSYDGKHDHSKPHCKPKVAVSSQPSIRVEVPAFLSPASPAEKPCDVRTPKVEDIELRDVREASRVVTRDAGLPVVDLPESEAIHVGHRTDKLNPKRRLPVVDIPVSEAIHVGHRIDKLTPKRRKISMENADSLADKFTTETHVTVQTVSPVNVSNDGHRWRKYGQKFVNRNPNPRSYYRCSVACCPARKHVERASQDPKIIRTRYEGQHNHNSPPAKVSLPRAVFVTAAAENA